MKARKRGLDFGGAADCGQGSVNVPVAAPSMTTALAFAHPPCCSKIGAESPAPVQDGILD
jgi:hypothetical protein